MGQGRSGGGARGTAWAATRLLLVPPLPCTATRTPRPTLLPQGVTFACVNAAAAGEAAGGEGEAAGDKGEAGKEGAGGAAPGLATYALRIKGAEVLDAFVAAVNEHKTGGGKKGGADAGAA